MDLSDIQFRRPNPQIRVVSTLFWNDTYGSEVSIPVRIGGKPFLVFTDENGAKFGNVAAACAAKLPPFGFPRLIDISDVNKPTIAAKLMLEVSAPQNCSSTISDIRATDAFGYSVHDCGVDNPDDAELIACSYHEAGVRVFDIHDPYHPVEIAYYKGAARGSGLVPPGSSTATQTNPDFAWAKARSRFVWKEDELYLWLTSSDSGLLIAKFTNKEQLDALHLSRTENG